MLFEAREQRGQAGRRSKVEARHEHGGRRCHKDELELRFKVRFGARRRENRSERGDVRQQGSQCSSRA